MQPKVCMGYQFSYPSSTVVQNHYLYDNFNLKTIRAVSVTHKDDR